MRKKAKSFAYALKRARAAMLLIAMLCVAGGAWADEVEIGTDGGTTNNTYLPGYNYYNYSWTQQIYTADEIGTAGTINSIAFQNTGAEKTRNYKIYMQLTDKETFADGTDWVAMSDADMVFEGELTFAVGEWTTITLDTPFAYDGTSNLLVGVADVTGEYSSSPHMACLVFDATSQAIRAYRDNGVYDIAAPGATGSVLNVKNQIVLDIEPAGGSSCAKPDELIANGEPTDTEFSFEIVGGSGLYNIFTKAGSDNWTNWEYEWDQETVNLTGLTPNTAYQVRVQSVCTDNETSGWKTLSFTTKDPNAAPTNLEVTDITPSSATLSWTPGYQETTWTVKYKKSSEDWDAAAQETATGTPTITLTGLNSLTIYDVQVYNGENYLSGNFTTAASIPLLEEFPTSSIPTSWRRFKGLLTEDVLNGTTALESNSSGWNFTTSNSVFDNHAKINIYGSNCMYWLVTPSLVMENNVWLTFDLALTNYSGDLPAVYAGHQADDKFVVLITTDNGTTWSILRQWDNAGSEYVYDNIACSAVGEDVIIDLSSYAGQSIAIAFYGESTVPNGDNNLHIDNVSIDYIPACPKPIRLASTEVKAQTATLSWTETGTATAWQICLNDDMENLYDTDSNPFTLTNLVPETTYSVKVRATVGEETSPWSKPISFTTTELYPKPTNLASTATKNRTATLGWTVNGEETAWQICLNDDEENLIAADSNPFTVTGLTPETAYSAKVRSDMGDGNYSAWSNTVNFTTLVAAPAPTNVAVSNVTNNAVTVSWVNNASNAENFNVQYKPATDEEWQTTGATASPVTITGLSSATEYQLQVQAYCGEEDGLTEWTAAANFTTVADNAVPTNLAASDITSTTATVSWTGYSSDSYNVTLGTIDPETSYNANVDFSSGIPADWTNDATYPWTVVEDGNGGYYMQSGNASQSSSTSAISVTAIYPTDGTIAFDAECRGEGTSTFWDHCDFYIDEEKVLYHGADLSDAGWNQYSYDVPAGEHTFTWSYSKDSSVNPNGDYFAVDNVVINSGAISWDTPFSTDQEEYSFEGLTPNTQYFVKVEGIKDEVLSGETSPITFTTGELLKLANDATDNSDYIDTSDTKVVDVKLTGRTLYKDGNWNTICLPFDVTIAGSPLEGATAKTLTEAEISSEKVLLTFGNAVDELEAGAPYIIKWDGDGTNNIVEPVFTGVTIENTLAPVSLLSNQVNFIGYYDAFEIPANDQNTYYMTANNTLKTTGVNRTLKACRAYFQLSISGGAREFILNFGDGETTGINQVECEVNGNDAIYDLQGRRVVNTNKKGLFIQNGKKVVIK